MAKIIGRKREISELEYLLTSGKSEFLAIYGRRRVGKSFLINKVYGDNMSFSSVGIYFKEGERQEDSYRKEQLVHFYESLLQYGMPSSTPIPTSWREAFRYLRELLSSSESEHKVVFLDELPWMAGPQSSELVSELAFFWNSWACNQDNIVLVVCGSATSWMLNNVIREYGGLYNRLTMKMELTPFDLKECEEYFLSRNFHMSRYEIALSYMALGGIPYYMDMLRNNCTLAENLDRIFFSGKTAKQEFEDIYVGLFSSSATYLEIVRLLGKHFYGLTRNEISEKLKISSGGGLSTMLDNLQLSGITRSYERRGGTRKETVYQLIDFYSIFYLRQIESENGVKNGWAALLRSPKFFTWAGLMFELLVIRHQKQVCNALKIGSLTGCYTWRSINDGTPGAQIDLVLEWHGERTDYVCEIKFSEIEYTIDSAYHANLLNKIYAFMDSKQHIKSHSVVLVMITSMGLKQNSFSSVVNKTLNLDTLFA